MYYDVYNLNIPVSLHQIWMGFVQKSLQSKITRTSSKSLMAFD
jgi:hypothetical protein